MNDELFIARFSAWAVGIETAEEWDGWAQGKRAMGFGPETPELAFTDSMFRRRLSQISKMTIQVVHGLLPVEEDAKMIFVSFRGELAKQYKVTKMAIEEKSVMPAAFSLSVFNAPIALASMALGLKGGYSAVYPGNNSFTTGLAAAKAALVTGTKDKLVFVYADEAIPPEYADIVEENPPPFAFGLLLARKSASGSIPLASIITERDSPDNFLKKLILCKGIHAAP
jgi:hypothetical protein